MAFQSDRIRSHRSEFTVGKPFNEQSNYAVLDQQLPGNTAIKVGDLLFVGGHTGQHPFAARVSADPSCTGTFNVEISWPETSGSVSAAISSIRRMLGLTCDLPKLNEASQADEQFTHIHNKCDGLRPIRSPTPFEIGCWVAITTRTSSIVATRQLNRLIETLGWEVSIDGYHVDIFPTASRIVENHEILNQVFQEPRPGRSVKSLARLFTREDLDAMADERLSRRLATCWGLGPQSAEFIQRVGFGRRATLPRYNSRLRQAVASAYKMGVTEADPKRLNELSQPYRPEAGYWAYYIDYWYCKRNVRERWLSPQYPAI